MYSLSTSAQNISAEGNARIHIGPSINTTQNRCLIDLRVTDPRDDKTRIERTKGGLLEESFQWIFDNPDFRRWRDHDQSRLLRIEGGPGKGKTMLLCGIINELERSNTSLVSFFFCQATDSRINNAAAVLRSLIYLLVDQRPSLVSHVQHAYDHAGKQLFEDANAWFALSRIFTNILRDPALPATCLIVDALDECVSGLPLLLDLVVQSIAVSPGIKWIVSSRNSPDFRRSLALPDNADTSSVSLELNANLVSHAVDVYIGHKVSELMSMEHDEKLQSQVRHIMRQKANGTFLWVALVLKELQELDETEFEDSSDVFEILDSMPSDLTELYARMMQQINRLKRSDPKHCRTILATVALAYRPLRLLELSVLADFKGRLTELSALERLVTKCGSFLAVRDGTIYFVHQSARDYLTVDEQSRSILFPSGLGDVHYVLFDRSLRAMSMPDKLKRNIYSLPHPAFHIDEIKSPGPDPLATIRYCCVYWAGHFCEGQRSCGDSTMDQHGLDDSGPISSFLRERFLYWLEALSLLRNISESVLTIIRLENLLNDRAPQCHLLRLVRDAHRFILQNKEIIESTPLQLYSSALIFSPLHSLTRENFETRELSWIKTAPIVENSWSSCLQTFGGHSRYVDCVAFSSDSKLVASGSLDETVKIWDATTGIEVQILAGHNGGVESVAFSCDSMLVAVGSNDGTIKVWDATTGIEVQTLKGHNRKVDSVVFSDDSMLLASGSGDGTVKVWDATRGIEVQSIDVDGPVASVVFSSDSMLIASKSAGDTILIWDATTGTEVQALKCQGHRNTSVIFSRDLKLVASGSTHGTIKLWDYTRAEARTLKGHSSWVTSIALSSDSNLIASGSIDCTIKIWDVTTGMEIQTLKGHNTAVTSVAFSGDSKLVASGSQDNTVKIWDTTSTDIQTPKSHSLRVNTVAFSSNSDLIATGANDKTVKIWDAGTCAEIQTLKGNDDRVLSVIFSSDSNLLASDSGKTIKIWDIHSGSEVQKIEGHNDWTDFVAFLGDCKLMGLGSKDTVRIWNTSTGALTREFRLDFPPMTISFDPTAQCLLTDYGPVDMDGARLTDALPQTRADGQAPPWGTTSEGYGLSFDKSWITWNGKNALWIPHKYRPSASAVSSSRVAIGCLTGSVITMGFSGPPIP